ncbi:transferase family-domain-containing protein [Lipomyces starkeyi]|uniref:Trichothecene 3-O-acetyltransferase-like N-terminal domain-containing protein n=1 Tax=Lipomyces starkeyi NRRL Y-11557 TaxID=675824 RepID=A0A1E3Q034_LIPST|nr:hypothetical protein LIPSTDRAFT_86407 [Lipomyces starkeyi NRRL Y-11557]
MRGPALVEDLDDYLEVFGQQPGLNIYTQLCFCFSVTDASSHSAIINTLTNGLERLSASFPWVAGQVVNESSGEGNPGIFKIKPLEKIPRLVVKDLRNDPSIPTMDTLRRANFPFSMLDESIIAPRKTLPSPDESASDSPLFLLQANFITGGLLLTFLGQHQAMDMTGQGQIIYLLSKACRNEPFTSEELSIGNLARHNIIPLLDDSYKQGPELARQIIKPTPSDLISNSTNGHAAPPPPPKCTWAYFTFLPTSLTALKSLATNTITLPSGYISTDDALSAFIWQSIIRVRLLRLHPATEATFARAVDPRRYLDIPQTYPGVVQNMTYHTYPIQDLVAEPLGGVASQLRSALDPKTSDLGYRTRALATVLNRTPDKSIISVIASLDLSVDIMLSSWAKEHCYELDINLGLGKPEAVRRPRFVPVESLMYLMPKAPDGEIALGICLRDEDMERLRADEEFATYATYIG